jgi:hypothetical protein
MRQATFDPPASAAEIAAINAALKEQREWLAHWHVIPWAPI